MGTFTSLCLLTTLLHFQTQAQPAARLPARLSTTNGYTELSVDGRPFLIRGGELGNSSASSPSYLKLIWDKLVKMHLNTLIAPVYWDLMEPKEGKFDYTLVDNLIAGARRHNLKLVLLWFGTWKNSMSCYAPFWVKTDLTRFPRAASAAEKDTLWPLTGAIIIGLAPDEFYVAGTGVVLSFQPKTGRVAPVTLIENDAVIIQYS